MNPKIWLSSPHMGGNELRNIEELFIENWISTVGPSINRFEGELERFLQKKSKVTALSSGTAAIHLALILAGVKKHDEVICQSFTFCASANPIVYVGANPIFIDSEKNTWNMCPQYLEMAIKDKIRKGKKPKAIIFVHLYGMPAKIDEIITIAQKYEIVLIEDAAEAMGSVYKNQMCGTFGDFGILSFNGNKMITTSGGGALICKNQEKKDEAIFYATQAKDKASYYQHSHIGYNYRMSSVSAAIGCGQMDVLEEHISSRQEVNLFYKQLFKNIKGVEFLSEPSADYKSNHWLSCILVDEKTTGFSKEDIKSSLLMDNIESRDLWKPLHLQPVFKEADFYGEKISEQFFKTGLCLPSGSNLTKLEKHRVKKKLKQFC